MMIADVSVACLNHLLVLNAHIFKFEKHHFSGTFNATKMPLRPSKSLFWKPKVHLI